MTDPIDPKPGQVPPSPAEGVPIVVPTIVAPATPAVVKAVQQDAKDQAVKVVESDIKAIEAMPPDTPWWAKLLVYNVRNFYKWTSTWVIAVAAAAPMALEFLPQLQGKIPTSWEHYLETGLAILAFVARIANQPTKAQS